MTETARNETAPTPPASPEGVAAGEAPRRPALSPSRAADFKQCPLLYRFRAIDRLPEVPSPARVRGTVVHAVLDRLYALPPAERVPAAARALVGPVWEELCAADPGLRPALGGGADPEQETADAWLAGVDPLLDAYFALEDPRRLEPQGRELLVEVELESGLPLRGYIDRVDPVDAGDPAPDGGAYRVVDYKTGTAPGPTTEARALFQLKFYALVLLLLRGRAPAELRLMYLTGPQTLHYVPDEEQLRRFGRTLDALWAAIRAAGATGDFRPNPGPGCAWCDHRARCPAFGGTPPPYPGWPADAGQPGPPEPRDPVRAG